MKIAAFLFFLINSIILIAQDMPADEPTTWAVVVGISDYQDKNIPDLQYAHKDAELFADYLAADDGGQVPKENIILLTNGKASQAQLFLGLDYVFEKSKNGDEVIIYFAGHGDVERLSKTQPGYLLCWNAPSRIYMAGGCLSLRDLEDVMLVLSEKNVKVLLIADTSHPGKLSGNSINGTQLTTARLAMQKANETKIISCQPDEYSIEGEQWGGGHGVFTYHLVKGLRGKADMDADKNVSLGEIERYLEDNLSKEVAPMKQHPMVIGNKRTILSCGGEE